MPSNIRAIIQPDRRFLAVLAVLASLVAVAENYVLSVGVIVGLFTLVTIGLNLLMGLAGQVSLGQAAFYGIGAYGSALLSLKLGVNPWLSLLAAVLVAVAVAYVVGYPTLRLVGHHLALATLAFGMIVHIFLVEAGGITGGPSGLVGIPGLRIGPVSLASDRAFYLLVWGAVVVGLAIYQNVVSSRTGLALRAIHGSEYAAAALGVDVAQAKLQVFVLSAAYAALAGGLYAHYIGFISPEPFGFAFSIEFLAAGVVGGLTSVGGPVVGPMIIIALGQLLKSVIPKLVPGAGGELEIMVFGSLLILILILMPTGIGGMAERYLTRRRPGATARRAA